MPMKHAKIIRITDRATIHGFAFGKKAAVKENPRGTHITLQVRAKIKGFHII